MQATKQIKQVAQRSATWPHVALPALTLVFGLQTLRTLLPYLQYLLTDRFGVGTIQVGFIALAVFATGFLVGPFNRQWGLRRLVLLSTGGLGLTRLGMQLWRGDPAGDMALAVVGIIFFVLSLPLLLAVARVGAGGGGEGGRRLAGSLLLGLALDVALHGAFLTYDYVWQTGIAPLGVAVLLLAIQWGALRALSSTIPSPTDRKSLLADASFRQTLPWLALGAIFFLELLIFQNVAHFAALSSWQFPLAFLWVLSCHLFGLGIFALIKGAKSVYLGLVGLVLLLLLPWGGTPWGGTPAPFFTAVVFFLGQGAIAVLLGAILDGLTAAEMRPGLKQMALVHGLTMVLLVVMIFAFYIAFNLPVPYQNYRLFGLAGLLILVSAWGAARISPRQTFQAAQVELLFLAPALTLLALPLLVLLTWRSPAPATPGGDPIRIFDYNVHNGFNTRGQLDLETLAQVIESQEPDIVTLQEVPRGWALNGSLDMAIWFSQRLRMPYVFTPSSDPLWGHAVFSRYPILLAETYPLPPRDLPLKRSFSYQAIDIGQADPLHLINTHYHHVGGDSDIRVAQSETIAAFLAAHPMSRLVLTGDLNAEAEAPEIQTLFALGFSDAILSAGPTPAYTYHAETPDRQIDYILSSPDLALSEVDIVPSTASDHLGIVATIRTE